MLIACKACHRQYEIDKDTATKKLRCHCGELCTVSDQAPRDTEMAHCSACGGHLEKGATICAFCGAGITLAERGWGDACPECMARLIVGASFCSTCGVAIRPEHLLQRSSVEPCPRCRKALVIREVPGAAFCECAACGGIWLEAEAFQRVVKDRDKSAIASWVLDKGGPPARSLPEERVQYLQCPRCNERMNRKNFAAMSGVIIDWCKGHGYWFDAFELERIVEFIRAGGMDQARARELARERKELDRLRSEVARASHGIGASALGSTPRMGARPMWNPTGPGAFISDLLAPLLDRLFHRDE